MAKREYVEANKRWLEEKAKEEGVMALPRGIYYKVLKQGDPKGAQPSRRSIVTAHYTGWTINGKKFDSSRDGLRQVLAAGHPRRLYPDIRSRAAGSGIIRLQSVQFIFRTVHAVVSSLVLVEFPGYGQLVAP